MESAKARVTGEDSFGSGGFACFEGGVFAIIKALRDCDEVGRLFMNKVFQIQEQMLAFISEYEKKGGERDYPLAWERIHMASCARVGMLLAIKRGVDPELAAVACSIHDFGRIVTGKQAGHAPHGYEPAKTFLTASGFFTAAEVELLATAAKNHSNKDLVGTPVEEIVKDADVLDCYQYGEELARPEQRARLAKVLQELGL